MPSIETSSTSSSSATRLSSAAGLAGSPVVVGAVVRSAGMVALAVVRSLAEHPSARAACSAAGVAPGSLAAYQRGLAVLAESHMITPRIITKLAAA